MDATSEASGARLRFDAVGTVDTMPKRSRPTAPAAGSGWRPFRPGDGAAAALPYARFARAHALFGAGDTLVALALAGSLFFSISPEAARGKVVLYLLLTMAPFAVVAPFIGPFLDRREGGR